VERGAKSALRKISVERLMRPSIDNGAHAESKQEAPTSVSSGTAFSIGGNSCYAHVARPRADRTQARRKPNLASDNDPGRADETARCLQAVRLAAWSLRPLSTASRSPEAWNRDAVGFPGRARTVACAKGAVNRPHPGLSRAHPKGSTGGYDYQRLKVSGSHSAILALIQLFELWKSLTAFPGPTSSSRRARS
jgi:hypothetical protein